MELPDGNKAEWDFVYHRMGAAAIHPVMKDGRNVMVRQYRNALERETLEIPAGCRDSKTEDTAYCAAREMEEETGYRSTNVKHLLSLRTTVAFCDEAVDIFVATDLEVGTRHLDEAESIDVEIYTLEELCDMIYEGIIQDGKTIAAIMEYAAAKKGGMGKHLNIKTWNKENVKGIGRKEKSKFFFFFFFLGDRNQY